MGDMLPEVGTNENRDAPGIGASRHVTTGAAAAFFRPRR
jgi:hypothetical protein